MTEPARIPCCIVGCRRTFKAEHAGDGDIMCGKHYRCCPDLLRRYKRVRRLYRSIERRYPWMWNEEKRAHMRSLASGGPGVPEKGRGSPIEPRLTRIITFVWRRHQRAWQALKVEAQRQQDAGFFAPRPRQGRKSMLRKPPSNEGAKSNARFEDQFQRLKRAQVRA